MMPAEIFAAWLRQLCLGSDVSPAAGFYDISTASGWKQPEESTDAVVVLKETIPYEPSWGGFQNLPKSVLLGKINGDGKKTSSDFLKPYLALYRIARQTIYLSRDNQGLPILCCPQRFCGASASMAPASLRLRLDKLVQTENDQRLRPLAEDGFMLTFRLARSLETEFTKEGLFFTEDHYTPIGHFLGSEFFDFAKIESGDAERRFSQLLLPLMNMIVTDGAPHLRAAELLLNHEFSQLIVKARKMRTGGRLFCVAALAIDMSGLHAGEGDYLVPWQGYLQEDDGGDDRTRKYTQDELFALLTTKKKGNPH